MPSRLSFFDFFSFFPFFSIIVWRSFAIFTVSSSLDDELDSDLGVGLFRPRATGRSDRERLRSRCPRWTLLLGVRLSFPAAFLLLVAPDPPRCSAVRLRSFGRRSTGRLRSSDDFREGVESFYDKRKPVFKGS